MKDEMTLQEMRGFPRRAAGRPTTRTVPYKRINMELPTKLVNDLDVATSGMGYTRTEALEMGARWWLAQVAGMKEYQ